MFGISWMESGSSSSRTGRSAPYYNIVSNLEGPKQEKIPGLIWRFRLVSLPAKLQFIKHTIIIATHVYGVLDVFYIMNGQYRSLHMLNTPQ